MFYCVFDFDVLHEAGGLTRVVGLYQQEGRFRARSYLEDCVIEAGFDKILFDSRMRISKVRSDDTPSDHSTDLIFDS